MNAHERALAALRNLRQATEEMTGESPAGVTSVAQVLVYHFEAMEAVVKHHARLRSLGFREQIMEERYVEALAVAMDAVDQCLMAGNSVLARELDGSFRVLRSDEWVLKRLAPGEIHVQIHGPRRCPRCGEPQP